MSSFEATEYIRGVLKLDTPIIALTADVTTADLSKCTAVGMNDYLAKPIDERILYTKIAAIVKKSAAIKKVSADAYVPDEVPCINLDYLTRRTKANSALMMEMISLYLKETPLLIGSMKQAMKDKDWQALYSAAHKIIPSFSIMGMSVKFENMAKKVQEYAGFQQQTDSITGTVLQLENVCRQACTELEAAFNNIKDQA